MTSLSMTAMANSPPNKPTITGPPSGKIRTIYEYTIVTTDPDGDSVTYCIDWCSCGTEDCLGPYPSGQQVIASYSWAKQNTYTIKVKARDTNGAESDYATLQVSMPKSKLINMPFLQFIEGHSHIFKIIRQLPRL
ncbi:MAG: hypothetical protein NTZ75_01840 [Euryarchaeota archaeon]|nr:hypothetical protein [Euryarchaeota archaeon]